MRANFTLKNACGWPMKNIRQFLLIAVAMFLVPVGVLAENVPVARLSGAAGNMTLTFTYADEATVDGTTVFSVQHTKGDQPWEVNRQDITKVVFEPAFANARPVTLRSWFNYLRNLESIEGMEYLNTSEVISMSVLFANIPLTSLDLSHFDTSKVTDMSLMFNGCSRLTSLDLSRFDTSKVTDMSFMFSECSGLTSLDLRSFNTANVTTMRHMISKCTSLTSVDVSSFNTEKVNYFMHMFYDCNNLTSLDISNFSFSASANVGLFLFSSWNISELKLGGNDFKSITNEDNKENAFSNLGNINWTTPAVKLTVYDTFDQSVLGDKKEDGTYEWLGGRFVLENIVSGISTVNKSVKAIDAPRYNLSGQRVGKDYRGVVIQNGKKFFATGK